MQPVVRALKVLSAVGGHPQGRTLQELADELELPVASVHRLLAVLVEQRYLVRSPANRRYFAGPAVRELTVPAEMSHALLVSPHPELTAVAEQTGETVFLTELFGDRAVCVALIDGKHPLRLFVRVGQEMPLHAAASARTLLSDLSDDDLAGLLSGRPLTAYTPGTPATVDEAIAHIRTIRERGYDVCADELDRAVWAVSAPVRAASGNICASVTVAAPSARVPGRTDRDAVRDVVLTAARTMSGELGYLPAQTAPPVDA